jgi:hypothetical protein
MTTKEIREKIQFYLAKGEIEEALCLLLSNLDNSQYRQYHDNAILLKAKWENIKQDQLKGIISREEHELAVNKIIIGTQGIVNKIDKNVEKIHNTNKDKVIYIALFIISIMSIFGISWKYKKTKNNSTKQSNTIIPINSDTAINTIQTQEVLIPSLSKSPKVKKTRYRIKSLGSFKKVAEELSKMGFGHYDDQASKNIIEISFSGTLDKFNESDLYIYRGGYLVLYKDGELCEQIESISIPALDYPANHKEKLQEAIFQSVRLIAEKNSLMIANKIKKCI